MQRQVPISLLLGFWLLMSCGNGTEEAVSFSETEGEPGYVHLNITNAKDLSPSEVGTITSYKIRLEGDDFAPIEQIISNDASGVVIQGIPIGTNRHISVWALNRDGQILREGLLNNVTISTGKIELSIPLLSVPMVLNLEEGSAVSNQDLFFDLLTDPGHYLTVKTTMPLGEVVADPQGFASFYPDILPAGYYQFTIVDEDSGKSRLLSLRLYEGEGGVAEVL